MIRIVAVLCLLILVAPAIADNDTHSVHLEVFCNSTGHIQLVSIDGGSYQNCEGGDCYIEIPNTTVRWLPCERVEADEIAEEVVDELRKYPNYQPLGEERIDAIVVNSSTYMKDSWVAWADGTLMPNVATLEKSKSDLSNCTHRLETAQTARDNIIKLHQPEIAGYVARIERLESDNKTYSYIVIGGVVLIGIFMLYEKGIISRKHYDKTKRKGRI